MLLASKKQIEFLPTITALLEFLPTLIIALQYHEAQLFIKFSRKCYILATYYTIIDNSSYSDRLVE